MSSIIAMTFSSLIAVLMCCQEISICLSLLFRAVSERLAVEEAQEKGVGTADCACLVVFAAGTARGGCLVARCQCRPSDSSR